jgi:predicted transglutaminase-like cysteine proteinase
MNNKVSWKDPSGIPVIDYDTLDSINLYANKNIKYMSDQAVWGKPDKWQTPDETEKLGTGDCEDYAIVKARRLVMAGADPAAMQLLMVAPRGNPTGCHMVLAANTVVTTGILWWKKRVTVTVLLDNMWDSLYTLRESGHTINKVIRLPQEVIKS